MAHQVELAVDTDKLEATIRSLYTPNGAVGPVPLSPYLEFHDPFVTVKTLPRVRRMFQKLHRWLPASEVDAIKLIPGVQPTFRLRMHYRRNSKARSRTVTTTVEAHMEDGYIVKLVENWRVPVRIKVRNRFGIVRKLRERLGDLVS